MRAPRPRTRTGTCLTALAALVGLLGLSAATAPAASGATVEVAERPADGVFVLQGHGWGHGRGMSQWGAQGAATAGVDADTILSTLSLIHI